MNQLVNCLIYLSLFFIFGQSINAKPYSNSPSEEILRSRITQKAGVFDLRITPEVADYIQSFTIRGRRTTSRIIARSQIYFPIIEQYLKVYNLPDELKYITVIESALNPTAQSTVGAMGLWQLMPATARRYGLVINGQIDERKDPHKSTQAALKYLSFLYNLLGDWTLAAAAYNCGGGGVQKAIRQSGASKFWLLKNDLPQQTQHYISRLAGAVYVMNFYHLHNLQPTELDYYMKFTKVATVHSQLSFEQISHAVDIPVSVLKKLNPSYHKAIVPDSTAGNYLILPKMKMEQFLTYYNNVIAKREAD